MLPSPHLALWDLLPWVLPVSPKQVSAPGFWVNGLQSVLGEAPQGRSCIMTVVQNMCSEVHE